MPTPDRAERQNIFLLVLDTLRADAVEPYGAPPGSSPTLTHLARRGFAVPGVRATASWTLPSHVSMFTGALARGLGLGQAPGHTPQSAAPTVTAQRDRLLAEVLRRAGYATSAVSTNAWAGKLSGFDAGFEEFVELATSRHNGLAGGFRHRLKWDWEGAGGRADDGAAQAETVVKRWVPGVDERPFFWFVNLVECHSPYLPPKPYDGVSALTRMRAADEAYRYLTFDSIVRACVGTLTVPDGVLERMRHLYARSLRYVDAWLERVLESLDNAGVLDETLVIVCSDHGENLGEGGLMAHTMSLDDRLLRVPLIVTGPGAREFKGMLSLAELPARIAAAAGLTEHPWVSELPAGLPVAQWDPLAPATHPRVAEVTSAWNIGEEGVRRLSSPFTCAVSGKFKLVRGADDTDEELYDLEADPLELTPLRGDGAMAARAGDALPALRAAVRHPSAQVTVAATEPPTPPAPVSEDEVADIERRMRLMGYM